MTTFDIIRMVSFEFFYLIFSSIRTQEIYTTYVLTPIQIPLNARSS